jgi:hypothetical protein
MFSPIPHPPFPDVIPSIVAGNSVIGWGVAEVHTFLCNIDALALSMLESGSGNGERKEGYRMGSQCALEAADTQ